MKKKSLLFLSLSLALGLLFGSFVEITGGSNAEASKKEEKASGVSIDKKGVGLEKAKEKVPFHVELPEQSFIPFEVNNESAHTMEIGNSPVLFTEYQGKKNQLITVEVTEQEINLIESEETNFEKVILEENVEGTYIENGRSQSINFYVNGKNYYITYGQLNPNNQSEISEDKLQKIANDLIRKN